jgi:LacI family kdg operon repressor
MSKKVTISDIAKITKVSTTTVSRFLNRKYDGMSAGTRERIQKTIDELGYRPNRQARALKAQHSSMIGIVVVNISNSYTSRMLKGMMDRIEATPYHTIIMDSDISEEQEQRNISTLLDEQIDGVIIQPFGKSSTDYESMGNTIPDVQFDRYVKPLIWPAVVSDNFVQSQNLSKLIVEHGYRRVVVLSPPIDDSSVRTNRYRGLEAALSGSEIKIEKVITSEIKDIIADGDQLWENVGGFVGDGVKTVIYAFNSALLYGIVSVLNDKGISIPEQVGVVGYDDASCAVLIRPGITSIEQDPISIGYKAADRLIKDIERKKQVPQVIRVESKLNVRQSL